MLIYIKDIKNNKYKIFGHILLKYFFKWSTLGLQNKKMCNVQTLFSAILFFVRIEAVSLKEFSHKGKCLKVNSKAFY